MKIANSIISDILTISGCVALIYGAYLATPPDGWAAWVIGGTVAVSAGLVRGYVESKEHQP